MSDTMLHGILQMPPELWTNDAIDIAQRHSRYLEASKRIIELERERDEARRELDELRKNSLALVEELKKSVIRLAKERDDAREELSRVRRELVASNRGAETNAKVNQGLCARLAEAEHERDEARSSLKHIEEYGTEKINAAVSLRQELTKAMGTDWTAIGYRAGMSAALHSGGIRGAKWHAERKGLQGEAADDYISGFNAALDEYKQEEA